MAVDVEAFIADAAPIVSRLQAKRDNIVVSDLVGRDAQGTPVQYVDIVMEGGGVLGVALVGYLYALESVGIRFLSIGGTSAGSIVALMLAAVDTPQQPKAPKLLKLVAEMPMASFVDGDADAKRFVDFLIHGAANVDEEGWGWKKLRAVAVGAFDVLSIRDELNEQMGLCPGKVFQQWVSDALQAEGISTTAQLLARMDPQAIGIEVRPSRLAKPEIGDTPRPVRSALCLIASDLTTQSKVKMPGDAPLYWGEVDGVSPAEFVRASMSIPFFFTPWVATPGKRAEGLDAAALKLRSEGWADHCGCSPEQRNGWIPARCVLVDGGVMSNFPIDAFHDVAHIPRCPTLGVKLQVDMLETAIDSPLKMLLGLFDAARHCRDNDFISNNPDFRQLVKDIDTGEVNWINFNLSEAEMRELFLDGVKAAAEWLQGFDWAQYKQIRKSIMQANQAAG